MGGTIPSSVAKVEKKKKKWFYFSSSLCEQTLKDHEVHVEKGTHK